MYQRGPQYGLSAAAAGAPSLARGRGRASVLPAWMTNPDLAREAQSSSAATSGGQVAVCSTSGVAVTAGASASSSSISVATTSASIALQGFNASSKPNHDNKWRSTTSGSRFDQPPTALETATMSDSRNSGTRKEGSNAVSGGRRPCSRGSSEMSTSRSNSRSTSRSRGNGSRRMTQTRAQRDGPVSPVHEPSGARVPAERDRRRHVSRSSSPTSSKGSLRGGPRHASAAAVVASPVLKCRPGACADAEGYASSAEIAETTQANGAASPSRERHARPSADAILPRQKEDASNSPPRRRASPRRGSPASAESRGRVARVRSNAGSRLSPSSRDVGHVERAYARRRPRSGSPHSAESRSGGARRRRRRYADDVYEHRDDGSQRRESSPLYKSCKAICSSLNGIRNEASFSRRRSLIEKVLRNVDVEEFVFEDASGTRRSWRTFERRILLDEDTLKDTVEVTRRVWVSKDEATSYCLEMEWTSTEGRDRNSHHAHRSRRHSGPEPENGQGTVALYEARKGCLTRCFFFEDPGHLCSPLVGKVDFEKDIRTSKLWAIVVKYLLKKGVSPSTFCNYWDSSADRRPASGREERRYMLVPTSSPHKH